MSQTYPYPWTVCHRHIPVKNVVRHFLKHEGLGISKNENEFSTWVSLGIFLLWSVNCSFHKRNENDFFTWVYLGIFLLGSLNHSFPKRNENDFFTWVTLGIYLLWRANHIFHKVPIRPLKTRDRRDRRSCQEGWCLCQIVASWDLFFGACHFCSMKTVDLATI